MDTADRIFQLLDEAGMEQKKFAETIGTTDKVVSKWRTAGLKSYRKYLPQIAEALGTTVEYLLSGEKKEPATVSGDGQAEKLAKALFDIGIDVDKLSETEISRIARLAKAALEE